MSCGSGSNARGDATADVDFAHNCGDGSAVEGGLIINACCSGGEPTESDGCRFGNSAKNSKNCGNGSTDGNYFFTSTCSSGGGGEGQANPCFVGGTPSAV